MTRARSRRSTWTLPRRGALAVLALVVFVLATVAACGRRAARCATCGMPIDPASPWTAELTLTDGSRLSFDTPRCALLALRSGRYATRSMRVQEYYDRAWRDAADVLFVASSDVKGPMGADFVPVGPERARQFAREHTGLRPLPLGDITLEMLTETK